MFELGAPLNPTFQLCPCCGKDCVRVSRLVLRDGKLFGHYFLDAALAHDPKICGGRILIGDPSPAKAHEQVMFTFFINSNYGVIFVDPRDSEIPGKHLTAEEAKKHPFLPYIRLIINLALENEKVIEEHLKS
jgi:hypothetical protein